MTFFYFTNKKILTAKCAMEEAQSTQSRNILTLHSLRFPGALCGLYKILLISILLCCSFYIDAQDCSFTLSKAQKNYEAGVIEQIPQSLQPCIINGFNKEEKLQAYKLIIQCYLFDNNTVEAEKAMLNFLKKNPEYEILPTDQAEFVHLFSTYRTVPIASVGILGFTNFSLPQVTQINSKNKKSGTYKNTGFGIQAGISYRQFISKLFDVNLECYYVTGSYNYSVHDELADESTSQYTDNLGFIEVPLTGIYKPITWWKFEPYVRAGLSFGYLLSSSLTGDVNSDNKIANLDFINYRKRIQFWGVLGGGICFNLKKSSLMLDLRYNQGFTEMVNSVSQSSSELKSNLGITENNFKLSSFWISVGYFYKFYKPEKKKNK
jgi:hypothetical protein